MSKCENCNQGDEMAEKKIIKKTVQFTESEFRRITNVMTDHEATFSEVICAACDIGIPLLTSRPSLIKMISTLPIEENQIING